MLRLHGPWMPTSATSPAPSVTSSPTCSRVAFGLSRNGATATQRGGTWFCGRCVALLSCLAARDWDWRKEQLLRVYVAKQQNILNYAALAWKPWLYDSVFARLERTQNQALCIITGQHRKSPPEALHLQVGLP